MKKGLTALLALLLLACGVLPAGLAEVIVISPDTAGEDGLPAGEGEALEPGEKIKVDGEYSIEFVDAQVYDDNVLNEGWYKVYLESSENGAPEVRYDFPVGTHTLGGLFINLTNRSKQDVNFLKIVKCSLVYDGMYTFDTFATQLNPDQVSASGRTDVPSIEAVEIEPLVSAEVWFYFAVPFVVRDSDKPLVAYVTVGEDVYAVDMRENMRIRHE